MRAAVLAFAMLLTGCGEADPQQPPPPTASPSSPAPDADGELVPDDLDIDQPVDARGADISWPQCPKGMGIPERPTEGLPMPDQRAQFVIIGTTNGPSFTANPCLAEQVAWARQRQLWIGAYAVLSWPTRSTMERFGTLRAAGAAAARYTIDEMNRAKLRPPVVWLDIETVRGFDWSSDTGANVELIQGAKQAYEAAGFRVGFYSLPSFWKRIAGRWQAEAPEWRPAGHTGEAEARNRCGDDWSFQGGPGIFGQWVADNRDHNLTCPGAVVRLAEWFTR